MTVVFYNIILLPHITLYDRCKICARICMGILDHNYMNMLQK